MKARHQSRYILKFVNRHQIVLLLAAIFLISAFAPEQGEQVNHAGVLNSPSKMLNRTVNSLDDPKPEFGIVDSLPAAVAPLPGLLDMVPGASDILISHMGGLGVTGFYQAIEPAIAFNPNNRSYLVVWQGDNEGVSKDLIYGQLIDATNGTRIGPDNFPIAEMTGDKLFDAAYPDVVYNHIRDEFLVVWQGVAGVATGSPPAEEIYARRVAADGSLLNADGSAGTALTGMLAVSNMGADPDTGAYGGFKPAIAYNPDAEEYMVVWQGDDDTDGLVDDEFEIFGQLLSMTGNQLALKNSRIQISDVAGDNGASANDAFAPAVAFNKTNSEWLVVWHASENSADISEVFGQRLDSQGNLIDNPAHNFLISSTPAPGNEAREPALAWNEQENQYLIVWVGEGSGIANEYDIFGRLVNPDGTLTGSELRISNMGPDGATNLRAFRPDVAYNILDNEFFVVWAGEDTRGTLVEGEFEVFGQRISAQGAQIGINDFRISDMGPDGDTRFGAQRPVVAYNDSTLNGLLVIWSGDDDTETIDDELEIFGRMMVPLGDIAVTLTDNVTEVPAAGELVYTLTVTNLGPDAVRAVSVVDSFTAELMQITWTAAGTGGATGFSPAGTGNITESGIALPSGASLVYTINTVVDSEAVHDMMLSNTAYAWDLLASDPDLSNNIDTDSDTKVLRIADLSVTKSDSTETVIAGRSLTYHITVANSGPVASHKTVVIDSFPDVFTNVSWLAAGTGGASGFDTTGTGHIFDDGIMLPKGATVTYTAVAFVDSLAENDRMISNTAYAYDSVAVDPDTSNNHATDDDTRILADIEPPMIAVGDTISLWPPNHQYVTIDLSMFNITVFDSVDGFIPVDSISIDSVWSDEPEDVKNDDHHGNNDDGYEHHDDGDDDDDYEHHDDGDDDDDDEGDNNHSGLTDNDYIIVPTGDNHKDKNDRRNNGKIKDGHEDRDGDQDDDDDEDKDHGRKKHDNGDGNTLNDIVIGDSCRTVDLRAERLGGGNGRVYTIHVSVADRAGNKASAVCLVMVPHDQRGCQAIDDGPAYVVISECIEMETDEPPVQESVAQQAVKQEVELFQNYPNPFNPETEIRFQLPDTRNVVLKIYNLLGQEVRTLTNRTYDAGNHAVMWNGKDNQGRQVASGVYIFQLRAGDAVANKRLILMR